MNLSSMLKLTVPDTIRGSTGNYHECAKNSEGNVLYIQFSLVPCIAAKDGTQFNTVGLLTRLLYSGAEPVLAEGMEDRGAKAYTRVSTSQEVYVRQLNKMVYPVATINIGSEALMTALEFHLEAIAGLLAPFYEKNGLLETLPYLEIFGVQNPDVAQPVVNFPPPDKMLSWDDSVASVQAAAGAKYTPKNPNYKANPDADNASGAE